MEIITIAPIARQPSIYFPSTNLSPLFSLPKTLFSSSSSSLPYRKNLIAKRGPSIAMALQSSSASPALGSSATNEMSGVSSSGFIGENDLLIVGPGVLGCMVAEKWQETAIYSESKNDGAHLFIDPNYSLWQPSRTGNVANSSTTGTPIHLEHPGCQIFGQTMTTDHHDELMKMGIKPSLRGSQALHQFPYVIFCAPPSRSIDYPGDVRLAASNWNGKGSLLFTSSSASYDCNDNGSCDEDSRVVPIGRSPRTDVLLKAEKEVLEVGGCVLRLAGLYKADRGAHAYWLEKGTVDARPDHILNLIHYEDAASLSIAIMKKKLRGHIFLGCDNHPLSRQELMDLVDRSGKFSKKFEGFTGTNDPLGKRLNNSKTRAEIGWEPKYASFAQFLGLSD